jgi:ParB family transcriptional regulator, chromosome partitioning protein
MARRRLTPAHLASEVSARDVPRAEHASAGTGPRPTLAAAAPIARVAGDAAGNAALEEVARELTQARESGRLVLELPLEDIASDHLVRDRIPMEDEEMAALRASIRTHGQRTPIEVTPLGSGSGSTSGKAGESTLPYGLISGWRRLAALKALWAETQDARFATIRALVRRPETAQAAYVAMVEENEIRVGLSQYERARVAALAVRRGIFESEKEALLALFASASRPKRSRIRAFLEIYHALDGVMRFPAHLPERLGLKLVEALRDGREQEVAAALARGAPETPEAELAAIEAVLDAKPAARSHEAKGRKIESRSRERAVEKLRDDLTLEQSLQGRTLTLKLTGTGVSPELAAKVRKALMHLGAG